MPSLVFVDTNILLDFYRTRGQESGLTILDHFDGNHDRIIMTYQVEMEYKKNRQAVILESLEAIKTAKPEQLSIPIFLRESKPEKSLATARKKVSGQIARLRERTAKLLENPAQTDPVYKVLQRLFRATSDCHLTREKKVRYNIRELAQKRFTLGYPPRKNSDTSIGDAINWEWIVHCADNSSDNIVIVSRDSDFGVLWEKKAYLNDWLLQEFRARVSKKRKISLTTRLTEGFKEANIRVTDKEVQEEEEFVERVERSRRARYSLGPREDGEENDEFEEVIVH